MRESLCFLCKVAPLHFYTQAVPSFTVNNRLPVNTHTRLHQYRYTRSSEPFSTRYRWYPTWRIFRTITWPFTCLSVMHFLTQLSISSASTYITSSNIFQIVLVLLFARYLLSLNKTKRLPKGPCGLPLIGYLPFIGKFPPFTLWKLSEKYGNIYT